MGYLDRASVIAGALTYTKLSSINVTQLLMLSIHIATIKKSPFMPQIGHSAVYVQNETVRQRDDLELESLFSSVPDISRVLLFVLCGICNAKHDLRNKANKVVKNCALIVKSRGISVCLFSDKN